MEASVRSLRCSYFKLRLGRTDYDYEPFWALIVIILLFNVDSHCRRC